jgi:hypothetical protein
MRRLLAVGFAVLVAAGPASAATTTYDRHGTLRIDGKKVFPVALLAPPPLGGKTPAGTDAWDEVVRAGANLLAAGPFGVPWSDAALARAHAWNAGAANRGVHTWVNLRELARAQPSTSEEARLREVVTALKGDPGLALWKGADEPWFSGWPPSLLRHAYELTRAEDPAHLSLLIQAARGRAADLRPYSAVTDVHSVDIYPVRYRVSRPNLHSVGTWTARMRSITPNRVVWTTLASCHSGSADPAGSGRYVIPSRVQMRYMIYDAIVNGARGLVFFGGHARVCQTSRDDALGWNWAYWERVLEPLVREVGPRSRLYEALLRPATHTILRTSNSRLQAVARRVGSEIWVLAALRGRPAARVTISGLPRSLGRGLVYREGRPVAVGNGRLTDRFGSWGVHVYRLS